MKQAETFEKDSLTYTFETSGGHARVVLAGAIDENADLTGLFQRVVSDTVMNVRDVERVNSMGVHGWVPLINKVSAQHRLTIEELSYALVQSANSVANMFGSAVLRSCIAPYFCSHCKQNANVVVTAEDVATARDSVPTKHCARCNGVLEFDELDNYFTFFKARTRK